VLWRVVLAVLAIFGGIGALIYLIAWLLLPADGDTASPIEALAGRGQSRTSTVRTIVGTVILVLFLAGYVSEPFRAAPLLAILLLGGVLLLLLCATGRAIVTPRRHPRNAGGPRIRRGSRIRRGNRIPGRIRIRGHRDTRRRHLPRRVPRRYRRRRSRRTDPFVTPPAATASGAAHVQPSAQAT
jgi:hypothetical protein